MMKVIRRPPLAVLAPLLLAVGIGAAGCGQPTAYGQPDSIIVVMSDSVWAEVEDTTYAALERSVQAVRDERAFHVTQASPGSPGFDQLKLWHQVVVAGPPEDELVRRILRKAGTPEVDVPAIVQAQNVWSRGQVATVVVLPGESLAPGWVAQLDELYARIDTTYRQFVFRRMFTSGPDSALADTLRQEYGFSILVPRVYGVSRFDSLVVLVNDNPSPSQLIRSVAVAWRSPPLDTLTGEAAHAWRAGVDSLHYGTPQRIAGEPDSVRRFTHRGHPAVAVPGIWQDEGDFPAAGPFVTWLVQCDDRTYFIDTWLYAPSPEQSKYAYLLQLERIRESFRCGTDSPA